MKNFKLNKNKKGSVLIFTLFIMAISLIVGIGLISSSGITSSSVSSSAKSVNSFQIADNGIEHTMDAINDYIKDTGNILTGVTMSQVFNVSGVGCDSGDGIIKKDLGGGMSFEVTLFDGSTPTPNKINCHNNSQNVRNIKKIKSVGSFNGISRSVESGGIDLSGVFLP